MVKKIMHFLVSLFEGQTIRIQFDSDEYLKKYSVFRQDEYLLKEIFLLLFCFIFSNIFYTNQSHAAYGTPVTDAHCSGNSTHSHYEVTTGSTVAIDEWGYCALVTNSTGKKLLVPTCASAEWTNFLTKAQAGSVSNVTLGCCQASGDSGGAISQTITSNGTFVLPYGCTTLSVEAWGAGGGGGFRKSGGTGGAGGAGGYAKKDFTSLTPRTSFTITVGQGGQCLATGNTGASGGTGGYSGGNGGNANAGASEAGLTGGGTGTGGTGGAKAGSGGAGGPGKWGGGGGGAGAQSATAGTGGGGATLFETTTGSQDYVVAGGGGGGGVSDQGTTGGAGGPGCAQNGVAGSGGDSAGGGGGGGCGCWNGSTLVSANCTTVTNGSGATAPAGSPANIATGGTGSSVNATCNAAATGKPGQVKVSYP